MVWILLPHSKAIFPTLERCSRNGWIKKLFRNVASVSESNEGTLKYQETLPKFPVPPLKETCQNYLRQYQPHVTHHEYERTKKMVEEFCKPSGTGEQLQNALLQMSEVKENWLSDWWRRFHLGVRQRNVLSLTPGLLMHRQEFTDLNGQLQYSAQLVFSIARFASSLARHKFPPIKVLGQPICMDQFYMGFSSCRIPGELVDTYYAHRVDLPDAPRHIVVIRNNHMFKFNILDPDKSPLDASSILQQLERIVDETHVTEIPVGLLTSHPRSEWAELYSEMKEDETNAGSLHDIQSSLFVLSLDQTEAFENPAEMQFQESRLTLCGGGSKRNSGNRWHDKTIQFFVGSNGECGMVGDHSLGDGIVAFLLAQIASQSIKEIDKVTSDFARSGLPPPQKLQFVMTDKLISAINEAGIQLDLKLDCFETQEEMFSSFGKTFLKSHQVPHDSFVQIAIQMAYWRSIAHPPEERMPSSWQTLFGYFPHVMEAVNLQIFKLGRLEHVRTVTNESVAFVRIFHDGSCKSVDKVRLLIKALEVHANANKDAKQGQGTEKHLFGLQRIAEETQIDASEFFEDPSWQNTRAVDLRTASLPGDAVRALYAPIIQPSCSFLWYSVNDDFMRFSITARKDKSKIDVNNFLKELSNCLLDLKDLLKSVSLGKH